MKFNLPNLSEAILKEKNDLVLIRFLSKLALKQWIAFHLWMQLQLCFEMTSAICQRIFKCIKEQCFPLSFHVFFKLDPLSRWSFLLFTIWLHVYWPNLKPILNNPHEVSQVEFLLSISFISLFPSRRLSSTFHLLQINKGSMGTSFQRSMGTGLKNRSMPHGNRRGFKLQTSWEAVWDGNR